MPINHNMSCAPYNPVKHYRTLSGFTQKFLADTVGMNITQIQKLESGERSIANVTLKNGLALADALGVDPHELIRAL